MTFSRPSTVVPTADERELLLRFLNRQREEVVAVADGLCDEQAHWTPSHRGNRDHAGHADATRELLDGKLMRP